MRLVVGCTFMPASLPLLPLIKLKMNVVQQKRCMHGLLQAREFNTRVK